MKKNFILFISLFAMFCVSCSQLFDFSAKKSSIAFTLPASVFSSIDNKREDWSPEPMYRSTYSMNVVITDQDGNVVKEIKDYQLKVDELKGEGFDYSEPCLIDNIPCGENYSINIDIFTTYYNSETFSFETYWFQSAYAYGVNLQSGNTTEVRMSLRWPSYFNAKVYYYIDDNPENIGTITMPLDDVKVFYEYSEELYFNNYEGSYYINLNYASYLESSYILENSDSLKIIQKIDYWINEDAVNKQLAIDGKETFAEQDIWSVGYLLFGMEENFSNPNYDDYKTGTIIFDSNYDSPDTDRLVINISDYSEYVETFVFSNYFFNKVSAEYEDIWNNNILLFSLDASINFIPFYTGYTEITTGSANIEDENGLFKDYKYFNPVISGEAAGAYTAISFENIIDDFKPFDGNAVVFKLQIEDKSLKDTKILFSIVDNCPDINNYNYSEYSLNEFKPVDNDNVYLICNDAWIDTFDMQDPGLFINIQGLGDLQDVNTLTIEYMIFPSKDNITILPLNHEPIYLEGKLEYENRYEFPRYYGVEGDLYWGYSDGSYTLKDAPIKVELNSGKLYSFKFRNDNKLKEETKSFYWDIVDEDTGNSILSNNLNNREQITIGSPVVEGLNVSSVKKPYFEIYFGCEKNPTFLYLIKDFEYTIDYSD